MDMFYEETVDLGDVELLPEKVIKPRPETKSLDDVIQVIKHNPANETVINKFIELYGLGLQWDWFEAYQDWTWRKHWFEAELAASAEVIPEDGEAVEPPTFNDIEPVRPELLSVEDYRSTLLIDGLTIDEYLFRFNRAIQVKRITVEVDGLVFDGDEDSQRRMLSAISAAETLGLESTPWRLANNAVVNVTRTQLVHAHAKAILKQGELWIPN